ncbi:MAG: GAF and ANTAR domain-containing protein [Actinobacteria bacterium]|nr:GAF and ANTAR domain-containing protein [Actinomycetota bacterium]MCA1722229.1 GAF and ANTAR domain-containing protein [Actinomycetota bacterium]
MKVGRGQPSAQDAGTSQGQDSLAALLGTFTRDVEQLDPHDTLAQVVQWAVQFVPGCDEASISVVLGRHRVMSEAPSGPLPTAVDALQERFQQGPCLDAAYLHSTVRVSDMGTETRWPLFAPAALAAGAAAMLSLQLYVKGDDLGALNLFSRQAGTFTDESEHVGLMFAAHAAVAYSAARREERMARGLLTQQVIGQAQGILMERYKLTDDRAFALLVRASQRGNVKLRDLAARLVHSGDWP